jgi:hypothetical protein
VASVTITPASAKDVRPANSQIRSGVIRPTAPDLRRISILLFYQFGSRM